MEQEIISSKTEKKLQLKLLNNKIKKKLKWKSQKKVENFKNSTTQYLSQLHIS